MEVKKSACISPFHCRSWISGCLFHDSRNHIHHDSYIMIASWTFSCPKCCVMWSFWFATGREWLIKFNLQDPKNATRIENGKRLKLSNMESKTWTPATGVQACNCKKKVWSVLCAEHFLKLWRDSCLKLSRPVPRLEFSSMLSMQWQGCSSHHDWRAVFRTCLRDFSLHMHT